MWQKISSNRIITEKEGYDAMLYLLKYYWELTGSNNITDILSGGSYIQEGIPGDNTFWEYWLEAVEKVRTQGPPAIQKISNE